MWHTYSDSFKHWFDNVATRDEQTKMINDGVTRGPGQKGRKALTNSVMDMWNLKESVETSKEKSSDWRSEGVIFEEAVQRCGTEAALRAAVARGAIAVHTEGGLELYSFARATTMVKESMMQKNTSAADTPITSEMHEEIKVCLRDHNIKQGMHTETCMFFNAVLLWGHGSCVAFPPCMFPNEANQEINTTGIMGTSSLASSWPGFLSATPTPAQPALTLPFVSRTGEPIPLATIPRSGSIPMSSTIPMGPSGSGSAPAIPSSSGASIVGPGGRTMGPFQLGALEVDSLTEAQMNELSQKTKKAEVCFTLCPTINPLALK